MPTIHAAELTGFVSKLFAAAGAPDDIASYVARTLVNANLTGHDSHGVIRAEAYLREIDMGEIIPAARPEAAKRTGATAIIDCQRGFGQIGARQGAEDVLALAREHGVGSVVLHEVNHIGRLGEYAGWLAERGVIGIIMTGSSWHAVLPYGGREGIFGTNPMAWAAPTSNGPLVLDFATSSVAVGKLQVAIDEEREIPNGWLQNKNGDNTVNPSDFFDGGALLPFGTYKGYGLNLMVEIIPILLAGAAPVTSAEFKRGNPTLMMALNIEAFTAYDRFLRLADDLCARVKSVPPAAGFDEVLLPGEPERRALARRQQEGIPLAERTWVTLARLASERAVTVPDVMR